MSETQFNVSVDAWFKEMKGRKGEVTHPPIGSWPADLNTGPHAGINNEYITTDLIRHYAEAIGDRNPLWRDQKYAEGTVWGGIIAPPTITDSIAISWATKRGALSDLDFDMVGLPGGSKRQWSNVIRPGDKFTVVDKLVDIVEKKPKQEGIVRLFIETNNRSYINQKREIIATVDCHIVHLATPTADDPSCVPIFSGGRRPRHFLSNVERESIYSSYNTETRRGNKKLSWNDICVGEKLKTLIVGPVTTWDTVSFLASLAGYAHAFDMEWDLLKTDLKFAWFDPKWNIWKCGAEGHLIDGAGHSGVAGGRAFAYGAQIEGLICRSICNWMGDSGFIKEMDFAFRNVPILGDAYRIAGQVKNKYVHNKEHLVELAMEGQNYEGLVLVPGVAKVSLEP